MKGFIVFYVNYFPDMNQTADQMLTLHKEHNKAVVDKVRDSGYEVMFIACTKEACRVEKVDFDHPFPRWVAGRKMLENKPKEETE